MSVQILVDGSFASRAMIVNGYVAAVDAQFNARLLSDYLSRKGLAVSTVPVSVMGRVWYNPSLEAVNSTVPACW